MPHLARDPIRYFDPEDSTISTINQKGFTEVGVIKYQIRCPEKIPCSGTKIDIEMKSIVNTN